MNDPQLTKQIQEFLALQPDKQSAQLGAELLLRSTGNKILYRNVAAAPERKMDIILYHLKKQLSQRLVGATHQQAVEAMQKVDAIDSKLHLSVPDSSIKPTGQRPDHDSLPPEIQQLWVDNASLLKKIRDCHYNLRLISPQNSSCPDSDRLPWAREIIRLYRLYKENYYTYDHYSPDNPKPKPSPDKILAATRQLNLLLGQYSKKPSAALAQRIKALYVTVPAPSPKLQRKYLESGIV